MKPFSWSHRSDIRGGITTFSTIILSIWVAWYVRKTLCVVHSFFSVHFRVVLILNLVKVFQNCSESIRLIIRFSEKWKEKTRIYLIRRVLWCIGIYQTIHTGWKWHSISCIRYGTCQSFVCVPSIETIVWSSEFSFLRKHRRVMPKLDEISRRYIQQTGFFQNFPLLVHEKQYFYDR